MSGGAYDYVYFKIDDFANEISIQDNPRRVAFRDLLKEVAKCAKAVEWADSGDWSDEDCNNALDDLFNNYFDSSQDHFKAKGFDNLKKIIKEML